MWSIQDQFNELVMQKKLDEMTPAERQQWADKYAMLLVREVCEFLNELNTKPHRKEVKTIIESNLLEEWIDIFKYWLCLGRLFCFSPEDFIKEYMRKSDVVMQRFQQERQLEYAGKRVVGVDIDGVLADYPKSFVDFINIELGTNFNIEQVQGYDIPTALGIPTEMGLALKNKYREDGMKRFIPVIKGAKEALDFFRQEGKTIVLLTARPYKKYKRIFADTQEWLNNNSLVFDSILWDDDKNIRLLREVGAENIDFFVEDRADQANKIAALGIDCYLVDAPYNKDVKWLHPGVTRVKNIQEVMAEVKFYDRYDPRKKKVDNNG